MIKKAKKRTSRSNAKTLKSKVPEYNPVLDRSYSRKTKKSFFSSIKEKLFLVFSLIILGGFII